MNKIRLMSGAVAALMLAGTMATPASAQWRPGPYRYHHYHRGVNPGAAAALGILGGLAVGGAIAASRPAYAAPAPVYGPPPTVIEDDTCYSERVREWVPGWGWQVHRRTVCP